MNLTLNEIKVVGTALTAINILNERPDEFIGEIQRKTKHFRSEMTKAGFTIGGKEHPISPVMLGEEKIAQEMAARMLDEGIYVIAFSFPVVAKVCSQKFQKIAKISKNFQKFQKIPKTPSNLTLREKPESVFKSRPHTLTSKSTKQLPLLLNVQRIWAFYK